MSRSNKGMTFDEALAIGQEIAKYRKKYGNKVSIPRKTDEVIEAISVLADRNLTREEPGIVTTLRAELTKANRQLAALNARYQKALKRNATETA